MSEEVVFGTLAEVPLRQAWVHEAHRFTPWLADNLARIAEAIGIPLELTGTEMRVGTFSADILARNPTDDSVVLIENQLEGSDHTHLGQIMTYLAGLETHTMIWIAPSFRDEHLSAIRWLNEHTVEPFAFFALRLRLVRIGDSPFAPLFEVVERPNNWDRQLSEQRRSAEGSRSELGELRLAFWTRLASRHPAWSPPSAAGYREYPLPGFEAKVVQYLAKDAVGIFVRPPRGGSMEDLRVALQPRQEQLAAELGAPVGGQTSFFLDRLPMDGHNQSNWDQAADWLDERTRAYQAAFSSMAGTDR